MVIVILGCSLAVLLLAAFAGTLYRRLKHDIDACQNDLTDCHENLSLRLLELERRYDAVLKPGKAEP